MFKNTNVMGDVECVSGVFVREEEVVVVEPRPGYTRETFDALAGALLYRRLKTYKVSKVHG